MLVLLTADSNYSGLVNRLLRIIFLSLRKLTQTWNFSLRKISSMGWSYLAGRWLRDSFGIVPIIRFLKL